MDIVRGMVVATKAGRRFVNADQIAQITTTQVHCALNDDEIAVRPAAGRQLTPRGPRNRKPWFAPSPPAQLLGQKVGFQPRGRALPPTWQGWAITIALTP